MIEPLNNFHEFKSIICNHCTANDWYCPTNCVALDLAEKYFYRVQEIWIKYDGDIEKMFKYLNNLKYNKGRGKE